jgi:hypothetical protein
VVQGIDNNSELFPVRANVTDQVFKKSQFFSLGRKNCGTAGSGKITTIAKAVPEAIADLVPQ